MCLIFIIYVKHEIERGICKLMNVLVTRTLYITYKPSFKITSAEILSHQCGGIAVSLCENTGLIRLLSLQEHILNPTIKSRYCCLNLFELTRPLLYWNSHIIENEVFFWTRSSFSPSLPFPEENEQFCWGVSQLWIYSVRALYTK